jgi:hypothetical protein
MLSEQDKLIEEIFSHEDKDKVPDFMNLRFGRNIFWTTPHPHPRYIGKIEFKNCRQKFS